MLDAFCFGLYFTQQLYKAEVIMVLHLHVGKLQLVEAMAKVTMQLNPTLSYLSVFCLPVKPGRA